MTLSMRDARIDFIKGMLMWCVVYGHTINALLGGTQHTPVWLHTFVRTFDMPFFMVLSGYFLKKSLQKKKAWEVLVNRISMILVPIAVWTLLRGHITFTMYYFLWAVLISSMVCIVGSGIGGWIPGKFGHCMEFLLYLFIAVILHVVEIPWNMFYLFPFFVVGYYMQDARFELPRYGYFIMASIFIVSLCAWSPSYTPWKVGAFAWKDNPTAIFIYGYRFAMGVAGVYVMARFFDVIRTYLTDNSFFVNTISEWGTETLALYILQSIVVERIGGWICFAAYKSQSLVSLSQPIVNLVGYLVAPILSAILIVGLMLVVKRIKSFRMLKYAFGFKVK